MNGETSCARVDVTSSATYCRAHMCSDIVGPWTWRRFNRNGPSGSDGSTACRARIRPARGGRRSRDRRSHGDTPSCRRRRRRRRHALSSPVTGRQFGRRRRCRFDASERRAVSRCRRWSRPTVSARVPSRMVTAAARSAREGGWHLRARCAGESADTFYPPDHVRGRPRTRQEQYAKRICEACPVLIPCRRYAVDAQEPHGIWGATTPEERVLLMRGGSLGAAEAAAD